jgi:GMP reductase
MNIENDVKLDYSSVLLRPKRSTLGSRKEVRLQRGHTFRNSKLVVNGVPLVNSKVAFERIPIMAANMDGVGTMDMADTLGRLDMFTCLVKTYTIKELVGFFVDNPERAEYTAYSMGITDDDAAKFRAVYTGAPMIKYVCIDVANGYSERFLNYVASVREEYPSIVIIAGNVVTADQTQELILRGADIVKVGIGPGSVCTTRIKTGVGYPQLSAVMECADAAHGLDGHVIADGGCTCPGDVAKAFAGGADFVMLGGMLAGHDEGGGNIVTKHIATGGAYKTDAGTFVPYFEERHFVQFYGMSSEAANAKHFGGLKEYRSSEGREILVPYRGAIETTTQDLLGGIRSACTYVGAAKLKHLPKCATFIRCQDTHNRVYE